MSTLISVLGIQLCVALAEDEADDPFIVWIGLLAGILPLLFLKLFELHCKRTNSDILTRLGQKGLKAMSKWWPAIVFIVVIRLVLAWRKLDW